MTLMADPPARPTSEAEQLIGRLFADPGTAADPYPVYRRLREIAPVHHTRSGHWVLSSSIDVERLLSSRDAGKNVRAFIAAQGIPNWETHESLTRMLDHLIWLNPPVHTQRRGLLGQVLTPRVVAQMQPRIEARIDELLTPLARGAEVDILDVFAFPLPVAVIGTLLGVPRRDWPLFRSLVQDVTLCVEPSPSDEQLALADAAARSLDSYFDNLIGQRRVLPEDDLISRLVAAESPGARLSWSELSSLVQFLFGAGFETTTNLIGNGLLALVRNPEQLKIMRGDEAALPRAVEELLRWDAPVQLTMRTTHKDIDLDDAVLPEGASVLVLLGAANRDPARYPDPEKLDVTRDGARSMSFGGGIHFCLGAALARLEGRLAFRELFRRFSRIELLDPQPPWKTSLTLHGLRSLPVRLVP